MKKAKKILSLVLAVMMLILAVPIMTNATDRWDVINAKGVSGSDIVNQARTYLGVPYDTSGGNYKYRTGFGDTMMFDCSGFVYRVCRDVGLASSRKNYTMGLTDPNGKPLEGQDSNGNYYITAHTQEQRYYGEDISASVKKYIDTGDYSELQAGDLLFITSDNNSVSHVVIYSGEGTIVHSEGYQGCVSEHPINRYHINNNKSNWYFAGCRLIESSIKVGDTIEFGSYPQSEVKDTATINVLNALAPSWDKWTSYGYYSGNGSIGSQTSGDWMRYIDIAYNGIKYRGVKFTEYRPGYTVESTGSNNSFQDENGYHVNTIYWFKWEPINWIILDKITGLVVSESILDARCYTDKYYTNDERNVYLDEQHTFYSNNYANCHIRKWLGNDFLGASFSAAEQNKIKNIEISNKAYNYRYTCENTKDKVFLLSWEDVTNNSYGFSTSTNADETRKVEGSDYAKAQGLRMDNGQPWWWLRTAGEYSYGATFVIETALSNYADVCISSVGIRPAICLDNFDTSTENPSPPILGPTTPSDPDTPEEPSTPNEPDQKEEGNIFTKIIDFFKNIINKILSIFKW